MIPTYQLGQMGRHSGVAAVAGPDPYFANVGALLHLDGANASTTFTDVKGKTWTAPGAGKLTTATKKFGTAALDATTATGGYIRTPAHSDFNFGTGDFTIEFWYAFTETFTAGIFPTILSYGYLTAGGIIIQAGTATSGAFKIYLNGAGYAAEGSGVTVGSGLHYYEFNRSGTTTRIFRDGVETGNFVAATANITNTADFQLGGATGGGGHSARGVIDDFRVTKGVARNTSNYTPPAFPHSDS
jgi:hypothetical protein